MKTRVKICGLKEAEHIKVAAEAGAAYVGFNFFAKSPRFVSFDQARELALQTPIGVAKVGLVVNVENAFLDDLLAKVPLDMIQLHGHETPERVAEVREIYGLPVIKAFGIASIEDTKNIDVYGAVADQLLVDAKPPKDAKMLGGNGITFDWTLVKRKFWPKPWMLAGGLTVENVASAIQMTGAKQVDLSSGVESAPGVKDPDLIRAFIKAAMQEPAPKLS
ncbi:phosphoribosylanthranilate isomerase [Cognatishimia activa]|uniref:N-(5'-phosphoribosyl)anthranilate isomerase n=1 Tax=Cognatishimia activa TaxID=1715691 RepID=A0A0P1ISY1_9RHOB|nr:phosphoribosylanthranilate isomerase [Cognatishimia activa]MEE2944808.1 phosphoribosylanthranilate isomerase [Pseudomonadota bacterium]CUI71185.1 N-(5'-phosphoribosyl)anthranilate isomerase [Cognatishimia activa]CUK26590.1 N-(5'-phosphoribosyl)anthranilate isomerase [Cognatishimia activa]